jgi:uncharacterized MAPEG superfamily protein
MMVEVLYTYAYFGKSFGFSSNRPTGASRSELGVRIQRTYQNHIESAAYGVPVLTAAAYIGVQSAGVELAALLFVIGRAAFAPLYYTGIPFVRLPAWGMGWMSIAYIAYALITSLPQI